jgi:hypothetical protein
VSIVLLYCSGAAKHAHMYAGHTHVNVISKHVLLVRAGNEPSRVELGSVRLVG